MGPGQRFMVGCTNSSGPLTTQLLNAKSGQVISTITQVGGGGGVTFNPTEQRYYVAAVGMTATGVGGGPASPKLGIVDADTNTWIGNVPLPAAAYPSHQTVAVNPANGEIYLPVEGAGVIVARGTGGVGGEGFALTDAGNQRVVALTWQGGSLQTGYLLLRVGSSSGLTITPLAAGTTTAVDRIPDPDRAACYQLVATTASGGLGMTDVLCSMPGIASGQRTISFGVQLNQTDTTSLFWTVGPAPNAYVLVALGTPRATLLRNGTVAVTDESGGAPTCYTLISVVANHPTGLTNVLCAVPRHSNLTGQSANHTAVHTVETMQAAVASLDLALPR
jgi:hypothetical protein